MWDLKRKKYIRVARFCEETELEWDFKNEVITENEVLIILNEDIMKIPSKKMQINFCFN